ncbi:MAG TPA: RNase P subunit [Candidatus Nitrosotenuis sp.]|nr:RNase P subunit [Candidatus Nitrosotenuis sp.]
MRNNPKQIALERIEILITEAIKNAKKNPHLAQKQAGLAKKISSKYRVRLPPQTRMHFCKKCKMFLVPNINCRVRLGRSALKSLRITCGFCNHTYRKVICK